ncbi:MAG: FAD-linked oxidase [Bacteroidia bacterium]
MNLPLGIKPLDITSFTNAHGNFTQALKPGASFDLTVSDPGFERQYPSFKDKYNQTTENFQWLIQHAIDNNLRLRPMGSGWSLSKVAVCPDGIVNTKKLRLKASLGSSQLSEEYLNSGDPFNLLFAQCGNSMISINELLEQERNPPKSLRASGGSNGQTIVGALSTNTHGAAFKFGSLSEFVLGMHIVTGPDRHVWIERASRPVTSAKFQEWIKAEVILDDDIFNSALISFGSFGFIHSVLIEVEPKFLLEQQLTQIAYDGNLEKAITDYDFSGLAHVLNYPLAVANEKLYHFELAINPHNFEKNNPDKGVYFRVMYKEPYREDYERIEPQTQGYTYGDDVLGLIQKVLDQVEVLPGNMLDGLVIPNAVNTLFNLAYNRPEKAIGTVGETFRNTIFRGKLYSGAFAFDRKDMPKVIDIVLGNNRNIPFAGVMAMRFVKGNKATLGFTRFENSCVLEMDGVDAKVNYNFSEKLVDVLEAHNISYTVHWGKNNNVLNKERVRRIYGDAVDKWLGHRNQLLSASAQAVFNNEFLEQCGLDQPGKILLT